MIKEQIIINYRFVLQRYALDRFEKAALEDLLKFYTKALKQLNKDVDIAVIRSYDKDTQDRLDYLFKEINQKIKNITKTLEGHVSNAIGEAGEYSYVNTNAIMSWDGAVKGFNNVALSAGQISAMAKTEELGGRDLYGWLWSALEANNKELQAEIAAARIRGVGYQKLMGELGNRYNDLFKPGKSNKQLRDLETVVKSYIQAVNAKAHSDIYEANPEVIDKVEWSAIMENGNTATGRGTCPRCMALDGQKYDKVADGPNCPLHPRCRCMYLPVTKTWKELGFDIEEQDKLQTKWTERAKNYSNDDIHKPNKAMSRGLTDKDYAEYWKSKPDWWQDNAVGPVRANMIRQGEIVMSDLVNKNTGRLFLIDELKSSKNLSIKTYSGVDTKLQKLVEKRLNSLPANIKNPLNKQGYSFDIAKKVSQVKPELRNVTPRGWPEGSNWDEVAGLHAANKKQVLIATSPPKNNIDPEKSIIRTTMHETGHALDYSLDPGKQISYGPKFRKIYEKDVRNIPSHMEGSLGYFLQGGVAGMSETFAESVAVTFEPRRGDEYFKKAFSNTINYVQEVLK